MSYIKNKGRAIKLSREEREIEAAAEAGWLKQASPEEVARVRAAVERYREQVRKDSVLNLRISSFTLGRLKEQAKKAGLKYQTYISGILDRAAGVAPRG